MHLAVAQIQELGTPLTVTSTIVGYFVFVIVVLKVFQFMKDRNGY